MKPQHKVKNKKTNMVIFQIEKTNKHYELHARAPPDDHHHENVSPALILENAAAEAGHEGEGRAHRPDDEYGQQGPGEALLVRARLPGRRPQHRSTDGASAVVFRLKIVIEFSD